MTNATAQNVKVALIGYGFAGRIFHAPLISTTQGMKLQVVASTQPQNVKAYYPETEVVPTALAAIHHADVELVVIATPNDTHVPLAEATLRAGKHVVVDKPFTITTREARDLVKLASSQKRLLSVFQNRRWDGDFLAVRDAIAQQRIGKVVEFRSEIARYRPDVRERWREVPGAGAGLWYDLGPHLIDQALSLFGVPQTVYTELRTLRPGGSVDDWFLATLGYGSKIAILSSTMLASATAPRFVVRGTTATLIKHEADIQESQLMKGLTPKDPNFGVDPDPLVLHAPDGAQTSIPAPRGNYPAYYAAMRDAIRNTGEVPVTPAQATTVMAILEAGIKSSKEKRAIEPELTHEERLAWPTRA